MVLFAARQSIQEALGFIPFEVVFGSTVCGPLKLLKKAWLIEDTTMILLDHVSDILEKLHTATALAKVSLKSTQWKMKVMYDKRLESKPLNHVTKY